MVESLPLKLGSRPQTQGPMMPIPDPTVIRNDSPCKAFKLVENYIIIGLDSGDIKVYDRKSLELLSSVTVRDPYFYTF